MTRNMIIAIVVVVVVVLALFFAIRPQSGVEGGTQPPHATTNGN